MWNLRLKISHRQCKIKYLENLENACGFVKNETFTVILYQRRIQTSFNISIGQFLFFG